MPRSPLPCEAMAARRSFSTSPVRGTAAASSSPLLSRRQLLAGTAALLAASRLATPALLGAREEAEKDGPLVVTEIEVHEIMVPWDDVVAYEMSHFHGPTRRAIYVVHTNRGFIGLGEGEGPESAESLSRFIGSNPFDWVADETSLALGTAMYDLMGQAAGVPCYKLIGPRQRAWVPVACWTVSTHPRRMANAVREYSKRGYTWLKYHLSPFENVLDQLEAMQAVAPKGFRVHLDLTMGGTDDHPYELLENITKYPIVGCIEDPKGEADIEGYAELRKRCRVPIYYHHSPLGGTFETQRRAADGYILGNGPIGSTIWRAGLYDALQLPFSIQHTGGNITRAMTAHLHAAFRAASLHFNNDTESWSEDVVKERLEPVNGLLRVSEKPGLGLTLDRDKLAKLKALKLPEQPQWIIKTRYANGSVMYNLADPKSPIFMVRPDGRKLAPFSYAAPLSTEYWDPDGTPAFEAMMTRLQKEGMVLERG